MAVLPVRLQLSRRKGFDLQKLSMETNGLPAINVARPSKWGNPYRVGTCMIPDARAAVEAFAGNLPLGKIRGIEELRGKNLACWCKIGDACHADILLKEANESTQPSVSGGVMADLINLNHTSDTEAERQRFERWASSQLRGPNEASTLLARSVGGEYVLATAHAAWAAWQARGLMDRSGT